MIAFCDQGFGSHAAETQMVSLNFEVAREAGTASLFGPVQAVQIEDKVDKQLSRLALSLWKLSHHVCILLTGLW